MLVQSRLSTECILVPSFSQDVLYMLTCSLRMWLRMSQLGIPRGEGTSHKPEIWIGSCGNTKLRMRDSTCVHVHFELAGHSHVLLIDACSLKKSMHKENSSVNSMKRRGSVV